MYSDNFRNVIPPRKSRGILETNKVRSQSPLIGKLIFRRHNPPKSTKRIKSDSEDSDNEHISIASDNDRFWDNESIASEINNAEVYGGLDLEGINF